MACDGPREQFCSELFSSTLLFPEVSDGSESLHLLPLMHNNTGLHQEIVIGTPVLCLEARECAVLIISMWRTVDLQDGYML